MPKKRISAARHDLTPFIDITWILTLGMVNGQKRKPFITANSAECLAQAAENGLGIIALSHDSMLIEKHALIRILPIIEGPTNKMHYIYPKSIKNLATVKSLGDYLKKCLNY